MIRTLKFHRRPQIKLGHCLVFFLLLQIQPQKKKPGGQKKSGRHAAGQRKRKPNSPEPSSESDFFRQTVGVVCFHASLGSAIVACDASFRK